MYATGTVESFERVVVKAKVPGSILELIDDRDFAARADRQVVLKDGRIVADDLQVQTRG